MQVKKDLADQKVSVNVKQKGKKKSFSKNSKKQGQRAYRSDEECYDQLQTQLEINQILIDKLDSVGVDVRELISSAYMRKQNQMAQEDPDVRLVLFTFMGRDGLI